MRRPHVIDVGSSGRSIIGGGAEEVIPQKVQKCEGEVARFREAHLAAACGQRPLQICPERGMLFQGSSQLTYQLGGSLRTDYSKVGNRISAIL
jgi:hypothetical protein